MVNVGLQIRTVGWLLGVIEQLYTEIEVRQRKLGDSMALAGKISMPDVTFAYFLQKYGRKNLVDEYVGSLVNTLERFREVKAPGTLVLLQSMVQARSVQDGKAAGSEGSLQHGIGSKLVPEHAGL